MHALCYNVNMNNNVKFYSEFGYYLHQAVSLVDKKGDDLFRKELGISLRQFSLLRLFDTSKAILPSQQVIADRLGIAKSAVSRHIDVARTNGWIQVETSMSSRRQNTLTLTPQGNELLKKAKELIEVSELQGFENLPTTEVEAAIKVLKTLCKNITQQ
jgi:DNA-binding MarR family transcriptional regulator